MTHHGLRTALLATTLVGLTVRPSPASGPATTPEQVRFFETQVRPVLAGTCAKCHGPDKQKAGLRLDSRSALLAGGDSGPAVVPGQPEESPLIAAVRREGPEMPPSEKLPDAQIDALTRWVAMGAPWPGEDTPATTAPRRVALRITDEDRAHWAFRPIRRPAVPEVKDRAWGRNPIDAFLLSSLEAKGLRPNPPAQKHELIRRVSYDLTGLPPTPREVEAFVNDPTPAAYEAMVERLLASPRYGEKWGRHWLDLVRFAETNSYERDNPKPNAWRYRDYVIRSFNADTPYDRFLREQLAGDELPDGGLDGLIATGFYRLGIWDDEPTDREQARFDGLDDIVATTGQVFLGLTVDCARCHDHKLDPIPQADYYRLLSFFRNINPYHNGGPTDEDPIFDGPASREAYAALVRALERRRGEVQAEIAAIESEFRAKSGSPPAGDVAAHIRSEGARVLGPGRTHRYAQLRRELGAMKEEPAWERVLHVTEAGREAPETFVLARGNAHSPGDEVEPGFLQVLGAADPSIPPPPPGARTSGRRAVLADWIASPGNPLTARVMANRVWQHHFGRGIVRSPNNFGTQGDPPTHPELLDWLAAELIEGGWKLKPLHRLILNSDAYRMSSRVRPDGLAQDPANDLFWRFEMRRLTAEEVRDSVLAVSGALNLAMYGPGVYPDIPPEVMAGQSVPGKGWGQSSPAERVRRSVYIHVKRSLLTPILEGFDLAEVDRPTPVRFSTTQPTQALAMLNGDFLNEQAATLSDRLRREAGADPAAQVRLALRLATAREPGEAEVRRGLALIDSLEDAGLPPVAARRGFALMVLNLNELLYLD